MRKLIILLFSATCAVAQVNTALTPTPKFQFISSNGLPLSGGCLFSFVTGTSTPLATYTDATGLTANANPVILDANGTANVWLGPQKYRLQLFTAGGIGCSSGSQIWQVDGISGNNLQNNTAISLTAQTAPTCSASQYIIWADSTAQRWKFCNNGVIDTVVGQNTTDTLTNKTLSSATITSGSVTATTINNTKMCDQFAGATFDAKVNACIAALASSGGTANATGLIGNQGTMAASITVPTNVTLTLSGSLTVTAPGGTPCNPAAFIMTGTSPTIFGNGASIVANSSCYLFQTTGSTSAHIIDINASGTVSGSVPQGMAVQIEGATALQVENFNWTGTATNRPYNNAPTAVGEMFKTGAGISVDDSDQGNNVVAIDYIHRYAPTTVNPSPSALPVLVRVGTGTWNDSGISAYPNMVPVTAISYKFDTTDIRSLFGFNGQLRYGPGTSLGASGRGIELDLTNTSGTDAPSTEAGGVRSFVGISSIQASTNKWGVGFDANTNSGAGWHFGFYGSNFDTAGMRLQSPSTSTTDCWDIENNGLTAVVFSINCAGTVYHGSGSTLSPSISFNGDNSTGFSFPGTGYMRFSSSSTDELSLGAQGIIIDGASAVAFSGGDSFSGSVDARISRSATSVLSMDNGTRQSGAAQVQMGNPIAKGAAAATLTGTGACASHTGQLGGSWAGQAACSGTTGASTLIITPGTTAPNGWACSGSDVGHTLAGSQSAVSTTACTLTFPTVTSGDIVTFSAIAY